MHTLFKINDQVQLIGSVDLELVLQLPDVLGGDVADLPAGEVEVEGEFLGCMRCTADPVSPNLAPLPPLQCTSANAHLFWPRLQEVLGVGQLGEGDLLGRHWGGAGSIYN